MITALLAWHVAVAIALYWGCRLYVNLLLRVAPGRGQRHWRKVPFGGGLWLGFAALAVSPMLLTLLGIRAHTLSNERERIVLIATGLYLLSTVPALRHFVKSGTALRDAGYWL